MPSQQLAPARLRLMVFALTDADNGRFRLDDVGTSPCPVHHVTEKSNLVEALIDGTVVTARW